MAKLLAMLPPERETFRPRLARLLVSARLETLELALAELSWDALLAELETLHAEPAAAEAKAQLAQGTASLLRHWRRSHPDQPDHLWAAGLGELVERLSALSKRPAAGEAGLATAIGLSALRRGDPREGLAWLWRGLRRNCGASVGQIVWAVGRSLERKRS